MSAEQTGHVHGMVTWGCPAEFLYVYWFFLFGVLLGRHFGPEKNI